MLRPEKSFDFQIEKNNLLTLHSCIPIFSNFLGNRPRLNVISFTDCIIVYVCIGTSFVCVFVLDNVISFLG